MLSGEDIVLLLKLVDADPSWTVRRLADETTIPRSVVHRAVKRLGAAGLYSERTRGVNIPQAEEFLIHGLRYVFPARMEGPSLGVPTAWAAPPLAGGVVTSREELPPVWPDALGERRGLAMRPLHPSAVEAARRDPALGERLALLDALRLGGPRIKAEAAELLVPRLLPPSREHRAA
jgi:hypothetical protein